MSIIVVQASLLFFILTDSISAFCFRDSVSGFRILSFSAACQIWVVMHHQYGISALTSLTSFCGRNKWWGCKIMSAAFSD